MKLFQWLSTAIKGAALLPVTTSQQLWRRVTLRSSLLRENHELRYQVELLRTLNNNIQKMLTEVKDENLLLWQHMDEQKEAEKAMMKTISDELQENMIRGLTPVGDA
jgi:hypothetical protein